ncbi:MAG: TolC family protein [Bacteroidetes bacterium]|nr:TolC family protein [Bacteroidota bacterium]
MRKDIVQPLPAIRLRYKIIGVLVWLLCSHWLHAQKPQMSLAEAEERLKQTNLQLLVARGNIQQAEAEVVQARLLPNPVLSVEHNLYNPVNKHPLDVSASAQYTFRLEQQLQLAAKRGKRITLAQSGVHMAEAEYYQLLRDLAYDLRSSYLRYYYSNRQASIYQMRVEELDTLLQRMRQQAANGNIPTTEVTRIEVLQLDLMQRRAELKLELQQSRQQLALLLLLPLDSLPELAEPDVKRQWNPPGLAELLLLADENRQDLRLAGWHMERARQNLRLQKAMAVPDLYLGYTFDRNGSAWQNYNALTVAIDLPLFHRNQGAIQQAQVATRQAGQLAAFQQNQVQAEVQIAYEQSMSYWRVINRYLSHTRLDEYETMLDILLDNFQKGNLGLLQFVDYYGSYSDTQIQYLEMSLMYLQAIENLNYAIGTFIF